MTPPITSHCGAPLKIFRYSIQISYQLRNISRFGVFHRVLYSVQYPMGIQWLKTWFGKKREGRGRVVANDLMGPRQLTCFCLFPCPAMTSNKPFEFLLYTKNWLHIFVVVCTYSVIDVTAWYSTSSRGPLFCSNHVVQHYICTSITIQTTGNLNLYLLNGALGEAFARGKPVSPTCYLFAWRHIVIQNMVWKLS